MGEDTYDLSCFIHLGCLYMPFPLAAAGAVSVPNREDAIEDHEDQ